jgi:hypothetical protein
MGNPHIADVMGYQRMYEVWRKEAEAIGYLKNLRTIDAVNTVAVATSATGTGKEQNFFQAPAAALAGDPAYYSPTTEFSADGKVPSGSFFGLYAVSLLISVQYGTITQLNTLLLGLGGGRLKALIGSDPILSWIINSCLDSFDSGYSVSNDNAATSLVARSGFDHSQPRPLPWVKNLNPAAQLSASFIYTLATIAVAFNATLMMSLFAGDKGTG